MKKLSLFLLMLIALGLSACNDDDDNTTVDDESYLTQVIMQHFAILDSDGRLICRTEYTRFDRNAADTTCLYAIAANPVVARSIFCHLVADGTAQRIVANADSTQLSYSIAGNSRTLSLSTATTDDNQVAVIQLPYPASYQDIATRLILIRSWGSNSGLTGDAPTTDISSQGNTDTSDARH